jgi:hypothetical protein
MAKDRFANYVVQRILEHCQSFTVPSPTKDGDASTAAASGLVEEDPDSYLQREQILSLLKPMLPTMKRVTYGKHIAAAVDRLMSGMPVRAPAPGCVEPRARVELQQYGASYYSPDVGSMSPDVEQFYVPTNPRQQQIRQGKGSRGKGRRPASASYPLNYGAHPAMVSQSACGWVQQPPYGQWVPSSSLAPQVSYPRITVMRAMSGM